MAFNAIPGVAKCTINQSFRGQECVNTMYFLLGSSGSPTVVEMQQLSLNLYNDFSSFVLPLLSNDLSLVSVLARYIGAENGLETLYSGGIVDGGAGDALPNNVAACMSLRTPFSGRHYRGRLYIGGIPRTAVSENEFIPDFTNGQITAWNNFLGTGYATSWQWVVVAQSQVLVPHEPPVPIPGGIVTPINQVVFVDNVVDSQRRRLPGRGK